MPVFTFQIGGDVRAYGQLKIEAKDADTAVKSIQEHMENWDTDDVDYDNPINITVISAYDENEEDLPEFEFYEVPNTFTDTKTELLTMLKKLTQDIPQVLRDEGLLDEIEALVIKAGG